MNVKKIKSFVSRIIIYATIAIVIFGLGQCCGMREKGKIYGIDKQTYIDRIAILENENQRLEADGREIEQLVDSLYEGLGGMEESIDRIIELSRKLDQAAGAGTNQQNSSDSWSGWSPGRVFPGEDLE